MFSFDRDGNLLGENTWGFKHHRERLSAKVLRIESLFVGDKLRALDIPLVACECIYQKGQ